MTVHSEVRVLGLRNLEGLAPGPVLTWLFAAAVASAVFYAASPSGMVIGALFVLLSGIAAGRAHAELSREASAITLYSGPVAMISAVQAAAALCIASATGSVVFGALVFVALLMADLVASVFLVTAMEREQGVSGIAAARLISSKYGSVFGSVA